MSAALQFISDLCWISKGHLADWQWQGIRLEATFTPVSFGADEESPPICTMQESVCGQFFGLPILFGLQTFQKILAASGAASTLADAFSHFEDRRSKGAPILGNLPRKRPTARGAKQEKFFNALTYEAQLRPVVLAEAPTGSGKTVAGLNSAFDLQRSTLIIVPKKRIAKQWREAATSLFGLHAQEVGKIEEGVFDYEGKAITVAVIHNLVNKPLSDLPEGFSEAFGTVIWDEAHNLGAQKFALTMQRIKAVNRIAMTATTERGDKMEGVYMSYFGDPSVRHTGEAIPARARVFDYLWYFKSDIDKAVFNAKPRATLLKILTLSHRRNSFCAGHIMTLAGAGRQTLIVSDRTEQLIRLMQLCMDAGQHPESMGLYVRSYVNPEDGKRKTVKDADLDFIAENCQIIFATYGMAREGLDIPRLDAGMDVSPSSKGTQLIGRLRRPLPGKLLPLWVTVRDVGLDTFENACRLRLRDYRKSSVEIIDHGTKKSA